MNHMQPIRRERDRAIIEEVGLPVNILIVELGVYM
jgi:hypothetical protein